MGNVCAPVEPGEAEEREIDRKLRREMIEAQQKDMRVQKFLLLGAGESGKSTIFKQARLLYEPDAYSEEDRQTYKHVVYSNLVTVFGTLAQQLLENHVLTQEMEDLARNIVETEHIDTLTAEMVAQWKLLWENETTQVVWEQRDSYYIMDNAPYFLQELDRLVEPGYIPTVQDILRTRVKTTGVVELSFVIKGVPLRFWDVGGQRTERKKWIHCFDNCQAVLFVVGMSEYDQVLVEDPTQNRLKESLTLFNEICNSRYFLETDIILFLNKKDLFEDKLKRVPLDTCFPDYPHGDDPSMAQKYIEGEFLKQNQTDRNVFVHYTCATDTSNMARVLDAARTIVLENGLKASGFV